MSDIRLGSSSYRFDFFQKDGTCIYNDPPTCGGREVLPVVASSVFSTDLDAAAISNDVTIRIFENRFKNHEVTSILVEVVAKK